MRINALNRTIVFLLSSLTCVTLSNNVMAQEPIEFSAESKVRIDSMVNVYEAQELKAEREKSISEQNRSNAQNLSDLKDEKEETRSKAKEAQRVEGEANDAARESRTAYRTEKKAQKARKQADKQAAKAAKARVISEKN